MELERFTLEELLLSALKAEADSRKAYCALAERVKNFLLRERLVFLAGEERKHAGLVTSLYHKSFPGRKARVPRKSPVPLPAIDMSDEGAPLSALLGSAMEAEMAANQFYTGLAARFEGDAETKGMLRYLAGMELGHYRLLEVERDSAREAEQYDDAWPMMHAGP